MATVSLIEYEEASSEVRAIYDDIRALRKTDFINNFWKALANNPDQLRRTWEGIKEVMTPGALDPLTKELIYIAVSAELHRRRPVQCLRPADGNHSLASRQRLDHSRGVLRNRFGPH